MFLILRCLPRKNAYVRQGKRDSSGFRVLHLNLSLPGHSSRYGTCPGYYGFARLTSKVRVSDHSPQLPPTNALTFHVHPLREVTP
jgi:hypothetical protein